MAATNHAGEHNGLHTETSKANPQSIDLDNFQGGANLARQISVQLSPEQFERLYLQPGGVGGKGDLTKRLGNPTPLGIASFLLCLTPFSADLMGWAGATTNSTVVPSGAYYFIGGIGLYIAGILEFILGNTFPSTVFMTFGGFWSALGFLLDPSKGIAASLGGATAADYNNGVALYLIWWGVLVLIYLVASLRTNVVFVLLFFALDVTFWLLVTIYIRLGNGNLAHLTALLKAAGAFGFLTCCAGWWLLVVLVWGSTGIPIALPVGDLSNFMSRKKTSDERV